MPQRISPRSVLSGCACRLQYFRGWLRRHHLSFAAPRLSEFPEDSNRFRVLILSPPFSLWNPSILVLRGAPSEPMIRGTLLRTSVALCPRTRAHAVPGPQGRAITPSVHAGGCIRDFSMCEKARRLLSDKAGEESLTNSLSGSQLT